MVTWVPLVGDPAPGDLVRAVEYEDAWCTAYELTVAWVTEDRIGCSGVTGAHWWRKGFDWFTKEVA